MLKFASVMLVAFVCLSGTAHSANAASPQTPTEVVQAFQARFNAGDLDGLMGLYGSGSIFVPSPGVVLKERDQIRGALAQFLALRLPIRVELRHHYVAGDASMLVSDWTIEGTGPEGKPVKYTGTAVDLLRKQSDGTWIYAIDNPFGVAAAQK